jgi:hypothetical protein
MHIRKAEEVSLTLSWDHTPGPDDREEWGFTLLAMALEAAMEEALKYRAIVEALRSLEADGSLERTGIADNGDWLFRAVNEQSGAGRRGGIKSLAVVRDRRPRLRRRERTLKASERTPEGHFTWR